MSSSRAVDQNAVFIVDTNTYTPPEELRVNRKDVDQIWREHQVYDEETLTFISKIYQKSGLGQDNTFLPKAIHPKYCADKPITDLDAAAYEAKTVLTGAFEGLMNKTGLRPQDVDIIVTTCSIFCPTPSMASMMVNHFGLRQDVQSYHLGGMGCANGVVAVNLVADLLQAHPNANAVLLTTETVTPCYYPGQDKHRMVSNLLFRMGGAAVLLSNNKSWLDIAKYKLEFRHRVHVGQNNDAYTAVRLSPDDTGVNGIYLGKNVVTEASRALTKALTAAGPVVLTHKQKLEYVANMVQRKVLGKKSTHPYQPAFNQGVQHFLLHAGGAKVLDGLGKALKLNETDLEPSRAVLFDYGNVSSSTTWYTLGYVETVRGVKQGDRIMQVGVGSGIKCGVNVWRALRDVKDVHMSWQHRVSEQERQAAAVSRLQHVLRVDTSGDNVLRAMLRLLFFAIMVVVMIGIHSTVLSSTTRAHAQNQQLLNAAEL